jgi:hypothetical protein
MELKLRLHVKPLSINNTYYGDKRNGKTKEALSWTDEVLYGLRKYEAGITDLSSLFDPKKHVYTAHIIAYSPVDFFYTKSQEMSGRLIDVTNFEKSLIDCIFLPKFYGTNFPKQAINLNVDDRYLRKLTSEKLPSDAWYFDIILRIENKPSIVTSKDS